MISAHASSPLLPERAQLTPLERAWVATTKGFKVVPRRVAAYDSESILFFTPVQYDTVSIDPCELPPLTTQWVADQFRSLVLGNPEGLADRGECPPSPESILQKRRVASASVVFEYLENSERQLVYSDRLDQIVRSRSDSMLDKIIAILCDSDIGTRDNKPEALQSVLNNRLLAAYQAKLPLQFVLPAFPFKDQTPFRTIAPADHLDFGDVALLIRLHAIALALYQVYNFGVEWIIVSDSVAYAPIFGVDTSDAATYRERLRDYRERLNFGSTIHILDLDELTKRIEGFDETYSRIRSYLTSITSGPEDSQRLRLLSRGMKWNMNTSVFRPEYEWSELWAAVNDRGLDTPRKQVLWKNIDDTSREIAIKYAAHNLSMKYLDLLTRCFPLAIRATVHPKPTQVAIPRLGDDYPWNGTAFLQDAGLGANSVVSIDLYKLLRRQDVAPVCLPGEDAPFYFTAFAGSEAA